MKKSLLLLVTVTLFFSCGNDENTTNENTSSNTKITSQDRNASTNSSNFPSPNPIDPNYLTYNDWEVKTIVSGDTERKEQFGNKTVEIRSDGQFYVYDDSGQKVVDGVFRYNPGDRVLKLFPRKNQNNWERSEWEVMYNGRSMVWTGTSTHGDNGLSMKFNPVEEEIQ